MTTKNTSEKAKRVRATDAEVARREAEALEMLNNGAGTAYTAAVLAERHKVSIRQARRYVTVASFELCDPMTPSELDRQSLLVLHRLDLIAGRAMQKEDMELAIKASKAHSASLAAFRRAIQAPAVRFKLPTSSGAIDLDMPF